MGFTAGGTTVRLKPKSRKYLRELPELARKGAYEGVKKAMYNVERYSAKHFTDHGLHVRSGMLRNSIFGKALKPVSKDMIMGLLGANTSYAAIHELGGTINHTNLFGKGIKKTITMPKRPYLFPALKARVGKMSSIVSSHIAKRIKKGK